MIEESNEQEKAVMAELVAVEEKTDQNSARLQVITELVQLIMQELQREAANNSGANPSGPTAPEWSERGRA